MDFVMKHKRAFIVGVVVLSLLGGGVWFLNNLPDFAVKMLINTAVSTNRNAKHFEEDALYVITTGTGAPLPDPNRAGPQTYEQIKAPRNHELKLQTKLSRKETT